MDEQTVDVSAENDQQPEEKNEGTSFSDIMEIVESVLISVFIVLMIFTFVCRPVTVDGNSMNKTLMDGDRLIMRMFGYTPKQGDIVIVENYESHTYAPGTEDIVNGNALDKRLIKRVIATEGQTIDYNFDDCTVTVDGERLYEDYTYIEPPNRPNMGAFEYPVTVPEGYIFVMGDNRNNSSDSRSPLVGFVKNEDVLGKAVLRFYPFDTFQTLN